MIDVLLLYSLGQNLAARARRKGHKPTPYVVLLVLLWFGGGFLGMAASFIVLLIVTGDERNFAFMDRARIAGTIIGTLFTFLLVDLLADRTKPAAQVTGDSFFID